MRNVIFADANTIWHRQIAEALGKLTPTIAFLPKSDVLARCAPIVTPKSGVAQMVPCGLPRGWASFLARPAQALLARRIRKAAACLDDPVIVLPSPAFAPLSSMLTDLTTAYYCADDYGSYTGWSGALVNEKMILTNVDLGVFVSSSLKDRAVSELDLDANRATVSPNATEARFADTAAPSPPAVNQLPRPIVGILGALSDRLDLGFIAEVANLDTVGTVMIAGPDGTDSATLGHHPKVHVTGRLPHDQMHLYARAMDVALIPYAPGALNHHCSPLRLWDHLATGVPIFALNTCDQVADIGHNRVTVGGPTTLLNVMSTFLAQPLAERPDTRQESGLFWEQRAQSLLDRFNQLPQYASQSKAS